EAERDVPRRSDEEPGHEHGAERAAADEDHDALAAAPRRWKHGGARPRAVPAAAAGEPERRERADGDDRRLGDGEGPEPPEQARAGRPRRDRAGGRRPPRARAPARRPAPRARRRGGPRTRRRRRRRARAPRGRSRPRHVASPARWERYPWDLGKPARIIGTLVLSCNRCRRMRSAPAPSRSGWSP